MMEKKTSILTELDDVCREEKSADRYRVMMRAVVLWNEKKSIIFYNDDYTPEMMRRFIVYQVNRYATSKMRDFKRFFLRSMEELHDHLRSHDAEKEYPFLFDSENGISDLESCFIRLADLSDAYEKNSEMFADILTEDVLSFIDFYYRYGQCNREEIEPAFIREMVRLNTEHPKKA